MKYLLLMGIFVFFSPLASFAQTAAQIEKNIGDADGSYHNTANDFWNKGEFYLNKNDIQVNRIAYNHILTVTVSRMDKWGSPLEIPSIRSEATILQQELRQHTSSVDLDVKNEARRLSDILNFPKTLGIGIKNWHGIKVKYPEDSIKGYMATLYRISDQGAKTKKCIEEQMCKEKDFFTKFTNTPKNELFTLGHQKIINFDSQPLAKQMAYPNSEVFNGNGTYSKEYQQAYLEAKNGMSKIVKNMEQKISALNSLKHLKISTDISYITEMFQKFVERLKVILKTADKLYRHDTKSCDQLLKWCEPQVKLNNKNRKEVNQQVEKVKEFTENPWVDFNKVNEATKEYDPFY